MSFSLQSLMASGGSVSAAFRHCSTTNQLSGDQYRSVESNLAPDVSRAGEAARSQG